MLRILLINAKGTKSRVVENNITQVKREQHVRLLLGFICSCQCFLL